ncbi:MAG: 2,3,4,5-tetrahydropyridine-2,6-dicarboxylate N-succinyltransferase [Planctomycetes bacterium]|nr:2,3,4,5-tetrahydropyridine-2,6-dicarboxylate N-succinyltransferase [Planctomycetota bacterium]
MSASADDPRAAEHGERRTGEALLDALERGEVRAAERAADGTWRANAWVKEEILALFRASPLAEHGAQRDVFPFVDKAAFPVQRFDVARGVRLVPGGSSVRRGAFVAKGVVCMPPMYVNVGAYVDEGTMIDSHALIGSCAQVGKRVHVSAAAQIGGVLEPANARPVILEDDVFVGGNCGVYEGILVRSGAVLAAGTILTSGTVVYDVVEERELRGTRDAPLEIPANAVVVPGTRPITTRAVRDMWANLRRLQIACAIIVKYRDEKTDRATALETALRATHLDR